MLKATEQTPTFTASSITICFATKTLFLEKEESVEAVETIELVRPGQIIATLTSENSPTTATQSIHNAVLIPGPNTQFSATGDSLLATIAGYPQITRKQSGNEGETVIIAVTPLVTISPDQMEASLTLYPPLPGTSPLQVDALTELLKQAGIRYGLNKEILQGCLEQSTAEQKIITEALIAKGSQPIAGLDAQLRFEIEIGSIPGKVLGNGKIDFHERKMFISVHKGQLIATKVPATTGTPGTNILGYPIPQPQGQDFTVSAVDNAGYDEESGEIRAIKPGVLSVVKNTIKVSSQLTIPGDINFSTGNIEANDAVNIGGSVLPGFQVNAHGDLKIGGGVRSATVISQGNVLIQEGVSGKQTVMRVTGDVDIPFVEQATITAGGTIIIRRQAYYGRIFAGGDIHCQEESKVIGGITMAGGNLSLGNVGSDNAVPALLAAGTDGKQYLRYEALLQEIREKEDELERCLQLHGHNSQLPFHLSMSEELEEMNSDLHKINLATRNKNDTPEELATRLRSRTITVHGQIFAGTLLRIGNVTKLLETNMSSKKFTLSADLQEIIPLPL
ncbi:MAG: FapA family protein [Proteobacteria bacterium]|nr:FapA family protein [Pseudomonadota bacterium]MBU1648513.1 FapA family protein [Pseudomonadota bacterium]MBU1986820.1 FapA family protein [Pseudomonadota bacterium]